MRLIFLFFACIFTSLLYAQSINKEVFSLLDLNRPGLETVKRLHYEGKNEAAAQALLKYYHNRKNIVNPTIDLSHIDINEREQQWADEALEHKFYVHDGYQPSFNYGKDINWCYWPIADYELRWQLHRHKWFTPMGKAYQLSKDEKYAKEWVFQYLDWIKKNPLVNIDPKEYEPETNGKIKQDTENVRFAWRPLETSHRLLDQINQFTLFNSSPSFTAGFLSDFLVNYHRHAIHVYQNYSKHGNHLLFEALRIFCAGTYFPEFKEATKWRKSGIEILNTEIKKQVFNDGGHFEVDPHYHLACIEIFYKALLMAEVNGLRQEFPQTFIDAVERMIVFYMNICFPDYSNPCFSDAKKATFTHTLMHYKLLAKLYPENEQIRYYATEGKQGKKPENLSKGFPTSGYFTFRNGWDKDATIMVVKSGPDGGWHCQPDNGTFELWFNGKNLFPDSGSYIFSGDQEIIKLRNWFRQTRVHNTLTLNNQNIETLKATTKQWQPKGDLQILVTENPSYKNLKHRRSIFFVEQRYFVIVDEAIGDAQGEVTLHYQLKDGKVNIDPQNFSITSLYEGTSNVKLQCFSPDNMKLEEEEGWYSVAYRQRTKRPAVAFKAFKKDKKTMRFITVIYPIKEKDDEPTILARFIDSAHNTDEIKIEIKLNGKKKYIKN